MKEKEEMLKEKEEMLAVMNKVPELTVNGLEFKGMDDNDFVERSNNLLTKDNIYAYLNCCNFIDKYLEKRKTINRNTNSYTLKHTVEIYFEEEKYEHLYVPNGVFIAAMISKGFEYQRCGGNTSNNLNAWFNISLTKWKNRLKDEEIDDAIGYCLYCGYPKNDYDPCPACPEDEYHGY